MLATTIPWWFIHAAPHKAAFPHTHILWGLLHGALMVPNFIYSLLDSRATIYQSPNSGIGYNFGYIVGVLLIYGSSSVIVRRR